MTKIIWFSRLKPPAMTFVDAIENIGDRCLHIPLIDVIPHFQSADLKAQMQQLAQMECLVFMSSNAVKFAAHALMRLREDLIDNRCFAIGPATAEQLFEIGLMPIAVSDPPFNSERLLTLIQSQAKLTDGIATFGGYPQRGWLQAQLKHLGYVVHDLILYHTMAPRWLQTPRANELACPDHVIISCVTALQSLHRLFTARQWDTANCHIVPLSGRLQQAALDLKFSTTEVCPTLKVGHLLDAIYTEHQSRKQL